MLWIDPGLFHSIQGILVLSIVDGGTGREKEFARAARSVKLAIVGASPGEDLLHLVAQYLVLPHRFLLFTGLRLQTRHTLVLVSQSKLTVNVLAFLAAKFTGGHPLLLRHQILF